MLYLFLIHVIRLRYPSAASPGADEWEEVEEMDDIGTHSMQAFPQVLPTRFGVLTVW